MTLTITWQSIITIAAVLAAVFALIKYFSTAVRWVDKQNEQDKKIDALAQKTDERFKVQSEEMALLTYGVLACLKGLHEQGCDGDVTTAISQIEKHINKKAHE